MTWTDICREKNHGMACDTQDACRSCKEEASRVAELKTPEDWLQTPEFKGTIVMDPDGWRKEGSPKWEEPITIEEFRSRLLECTVLIAQEGK